MGLVEASTLVDMIRPLCEQTTRLLKPWNVSQWDRLLLEIDKSDPDSFRVSLRCTGPNEWSAPSQEARRWAASVPESYFDARHGMRWRMAATDLTCLLILATWPRDHIEASDEAIKTVDLQTMRFVSGIGIAKAQAEFKESKTIPDDCAEDSPGDFALSPYQSLAAWCASESPEGFALFMEQGTGKTPVQIRHCELEMAKRESDEPFRALVICPPNVRANWGYELRKFVRPSGEELDYLFINCTGGKIERTKHVFDVIAAEKPPHDRIVLAVSYGAFKNTLAAFCSVEWDLVSVDESHNFKSKNTKLWSALLKLRDCAKKRTALTGTPVANTLMDLWTQLEWLGKGVSGFHTFEAFKSFHGAYFSDGAGFERLLGYQNVPLLQERLARYSFIIRLREALPDLPERTYDVATCEMSQEQRELYVNMRDVLRAEIEDDLSSDMPEAVTANNVLTKLLRLSQITSGFLKIDDVYDFDTGELVKPGGINRLDPNPKLELLVEKRLSDRKTSKAITWCTHTQDIRSITARLNAEGFKARSFYGATRPNEREEIMRLFNTTHEVTDIVAQPKTMKEGVTLLGAVDEDTNCDRVYVYSKNWSILERLQMLGRNHRRGTRVHTQVTDLHCDDSIDEDIYAVLQRKEGDALAIQDVRAILKRVLEL